MGLRQVIWFSPEWWLAYSGRYAAAGASAHGAVLPPRRCCWGSHWNTSVYGNPCVRPLGWLCFDDCSLHTTSLTSKQSHQLLGTADDLPSIHLPLPVTFHQNTFTYFHFLQILLIARFHLWMEIQCKFYFYFHGLEYIFHQMFLYSLFVLHHL